jgi:uncharacterized protein
MPPPPAPRQYAAAATAMSLEDLDIWLRERAKADPPPLATSLSMLDGFVSAVVAGPVSMDTRAWICPLLGIDPDAFDHGGTPQFAALCAVIVRHNAISDTLPTRRDLYQPILACVPGDQGLSPLTGDDPIGQALFATLWRDIPISVDAIRKFWMPTRFKTNTAKPKRRRSR